ncbi:MAG: hypothetical protein HC806_07850 [Anaerolineae bacterium]|nr:hypothetical protein [Anaerolineae bacterium]
MVLLFCIIVGLFAIPRIRNLVAGTDGTTPTSPQGVAQTTGETPGQTALATETPAPTQTHTPTPTATNTSTPTSTPTVTLTPTPEGPYVVLTGIRIENGVYVIDYEANNYPAEQPNMHVHMFFNTVPPDQAGSPGSGPWKLTFGPFGPPPFTQYGPANRPANATQMCGLVANSNHSVIPNSGNCIDLPQ